MAINYEIQDDFLQSHKHTFDYQANRRKYLQYASMKSKEFIDCLKNPVSLEEIAHITAHVMWAKAFRDHVYRDQLSDTGIIHLLIHCIGNHNECERHGKTIHKLFKKYVILS